MADLEKARNQYPVPETEADNILLLDALRERLQTDASVYFAGELSSPEDDGSRFDQHVLYIAPTTPHFDPADLTAFMEETLAGFTMTSTRNARLHQSGDIQLPTAFVDQHIGDREVNVRTTTTIRTGLFKGRGGESVEEVTNREKLIQRTTVKVYTDPLLAQTLFDYCESSLRGELDEQRSTNMSGVDGTHVLPAAHLSGLKSYYRNSGNNVPLPTRSRQI